MYGIDNAQGQGDSNKRNYLKEAGLHENGKFLALTYGATETYEYFDIEVETADGRYLRERTFGPNKDIVFPKDIYKNREKVGRETNEQAFDRLVRETNTKLLYLASCFATKADIENSVKSLSTLKGFVEAVNKVIGEPANSINFLTIWKNNDSKQRSNLIFAERCKWCEPHTEGKAATIRLNPWQQANQTVEKFPYVSNEAAATGETIIPGEEQEAIASDALPF